MKKLHSIVPYPGSYSWTAPSGSRYTVTDEGPCYTVFRNGEFIGAIDGADDLDTFGKMNHFPG